MPLTKRSISPVRISLHRLPPNVRENELECVANGTLANLVRQMSSLSRHAEDIFGELFREAVKIEHKTSILFNRIDRIALKVTQLDSNVEEVSLQDLHLRKPFKSSTLIDQQSLSRQTMPAAMTECYGQCDRPPELSKLNPYRTDGKAALKFYTDPEYFFDLWRQEMLKDADHTKKTKNVNRPKSGEPTKKRKSPRQPHDHRQKFYDKAIRTGEYIQQVPVEYQSAEAMRQQQQMANGGGGVGQQRYPANQAPPIGMVRPESLELHQSTNTYYPSSGYGSMSGGHPNSGEYHRPSMTGAVERYAASSANYVAYAPINRSQTRGGHETLPSNGGASVGSTPTTLNDVNQMSPRSVSSSDSSGPSRSGSRPAQAPPAPPPPMLAQAVRVAPAVPDSNGDMVRVQLSRMRVVDSSSSAAEILRFSRTMSPQQHQVPPHDRSGSPELPPPPPPLMYSDSQEITAASPPGKKEMSPPGKFYSSPPPPPPPPPNVNGFKVETTSVTVTSATVSFQSNEQAKMVKSASSHGGAGGGKQMDARSDLLKAIREGIQLKKMDRKEEKEREEDTATKGHDVAAILKRRMEDVMGRSESEESASDFDDDWDD